LNLTTKTPRHQVFVSLCAFVPLWLKSGVVIAFHKPYGVLSQFTDDLPRQSVASAGGSQNRTLAEFGFPKDVYPIGRLDADSEGLLLLSDEARWNERLLHPRHAHEREYWAQVERIPSAEALKQLEKGVLIQGRKTLPCRAWMLEPQPEVGSSRCDDRTAQRAVPTRTPPIRFRKSVPDCWIGLELVEGKNRQVRRMTAAIGHPTLRLVRVRIGKFWLGDLAPGKWQMLSPEQVRLLI
jgi:23S rRNA pseudouridine2457 synthase